MCVFWSRGGNYPKKKRGEDYLLICCWLDHSTTPCHSPVLTVCTLLSPSSIALTFLWFILSFPFLSRSTSFVFTLSYIIILPSESGESIRTSQDTCFDYGTWISFIRYREESGAQVSIHLVLESMDELFSYTQKSVPCYPNCQFITW